MNSLFKSFLNVRFNEVIEFVMSRYNDDDCSTVLLVASLVFILFGLMSILYNMIFNNHNKLSIVEKIELFFYNLILLINYINNNKIKAFCLFCFMYIVLSILRLYTCSKLNLDINVYGHFIFLILAFWVPISVIISTFSFIKLKNNIKFSYSLFIKYIISDITLSNLIKVLILSSLMYYIRILISTWITKNINYFKPFIDNLYSLAPLLCNYVILFITCAIAILPKYHKYLWYFRPAMSYYNRANVIRSSPRGGAVIAGLASSSAVASTSAQGEVEASEIETNKSTRSTRSQFNFLQNHLVSNPPTTNTDVNMEVSRTYLKLRQKIMGHRLPSFWEMSEEQWRQWYSDGRLRDALAREYYCGTNTPPMGGVRWQAWRSARILEKVHNRYMPVWIHPEIMTRELNAFIGKDNWGLHSGYKLAQPVGTTNVHMQFEALATMFPFHPMEACYVPEPKIRTLSRHIAVELSHDVWNGVKITRNTFNHTGFRYLRRICNAFPEVVRASIHPDNSLTLNQLRQHQVYGKLLTKMEKNLIDRYCDNEFRDYYYDYEGGVIPLFNLIKEFLAAVKLYEETRIRLRNDLISRVQEVDGNLQFAQEVAYGITHRPYHVARLPVNIGNSVIIKDHFIQFHQAFINTRYAERTNRGWYDMAIFK